jgi:hypothetical protein
MAPASKAPKAALLVIVAAIVILYLRFTSSEIEQMHAEQSSHKDSKGAAAHVEPAVSHEQPAAQQQQREIVPYSKALIAPRKIAMLDSEAALLWRELHDATTYLEYGCGGSTYLSMRVDSISHIFSVESDKVWLGIVREDPVVAAAEKSKHLKLIHADIGPIISLGKPADEASKHKWPNYPQVQFF